MPDPFSNFRSGLESPASYLSVVTPNDSSDLSNPCRALNVATSGMVSVTTVGGTTATVYIAAGVAFPVRAQRVLATDTTATGIVAMW